MSRFNINIPPTLIDRDGTKYTGRYVAGINNYENHVATLEPGDDDIPKVFVDGVIPTTKDDVLAEMTYISKTDKFHAYLKIKCQGSSSMAYSKKNFTIKMYSDESRKTKLKKAFKDWKYAQNKYVLKANYIDHSHARNIVSARLWDEVVASRSDYVSLPTEFKASPKNGAIDGFPIKLYANDTYQGIYTWNIGKDDWMWNMDEDNPNHILVCGETNTNDTYAETPCNFRKLWSGIHENNWSVEVGTNGDDVKNSLNALITCVKDTDDETFKATIGNHLDVQSAIDYWIHQYIICGLDGLGKNMLLGTYDLQKWIMGAYDMDSTFGLWWEGNSFVSAEYRCPEDYQEKYNLLFERITELYSERVVERYAELRSTVYSFSNLCDHFERFTDIIGKDLYAEDLEIYSIPSGSTNNIKQIRDYIRGRLEYCDDMFYGVEIDYTLNPLANVEWYNNKCYLVYDGIMRDDKTGEHCTSKFTLQDCVYKFNGPDGLTYTALYVWDSEGIFLGAIESVTVLEYFTARSDYQYALKYHHESGVDSASISLMPYNNSDTATENISISLSELTFTDRFNQALETDIASLFGNDVTDIHNKIKSANTIIHMSSNRAVEDNYSGIGTGEKAFFPCLYQYSNQLLLITRKFDNSPEDALAFFGENNTTITFNNINNNTNDIIYKLAQPMVFDGTSTYLDTGLQLFSEPKDSTIFIDFESADAQSETNEAMLMISCSEENTNKSDVRIHKAPTNNFVTFKTNSVEPIIEDVVDNSWGHNWANVRKIALVFKDGLFEYGKYYGLNNTQPRYLEKKDGEVFSENNASLIIGARANYYTPGTYLDFWKGTVNDFRVYNRALSEEELNALILGY